MWTRPTHPGAADDLLGKLQARVDAREAFEVTHEDRALVLRLAEDSRHVVGLPDTPEQLADRLLATGALAGYVREWASRAKDA